MKYTLEPERDKAPLEITKFELEMPPLPKETKDKTEDLTDGTTDRWEDTAIERRKELDDLEKRAKHTVPFSTWAGSKIYSYEEFCKIGLGVRSLGNWHLKESNEYFNQFHVLKREGILLKLVKSGLGLTEATILLDKSLNKVLEMIDEQLDSDEIALTLLKLENI
jgi:hypothetical protein